MTRDLDVSISQRLAYGFATMLLVLGLFVIATYRWQEESAAAQRAVTHEVGPRVDAAREMERAFLYAAIAVRRYFWTPNAETRQAADARFDAILVALERLRGVADRDGGSGLVDRLEPLAQHYVGTGHELMKVPTDEFRAREPGLGNEREAALVVLREYLALQERRSAEAVASMAAARDRASTGMRIASALVIAVFIVLAVWTSGGVRRPVARLVELAQAMQQGDWAPALQWVPRDREGGAPGRRRSEWRQVAEAFGVAAAALEAREQRLHATAVVASAAASSLNPGLVADATLRALLGYVRAEVAAIYWRDGDMLQPIGRFGLDGQVVPIPVGEGLPGQVFRDGKSAIITDIPPDSGFQVRIGFDQAPPRTIAAVPACFGETVLGVIVVGSLRPIDADVVAFLESTGAQLGVALQHLRAHDHIRQLLEQLRSTAEQIQAQNEELQAQNEEIQAQSEEIQAQNEEIQAQNDELQSRNARIEEQRHELQAQYRQLQERGEALHAQAQLLSEADARKNEFLGWLAHELRNPMAPITTSLHVLRGVAPGSEPARRALEVIERQSRHLVRLIDDLLDITRISHGKIDIRRERVDLCDVLRASVEDHRAALASHALSVDVSCPDGPVWIDGDRTRLSQVLGNLLSNAIKFTNTGGNVRLTIAEDAERQRAVVRVADDGVGIPPALLPHLFKPFSQGPTTIARTRGGLGLGLALVKVLIELHGGTVNVSSGGPGKGTEFTLRLPLANGAHQVPEIDGHLAATLPAEGHRVLIIEDNVDAATSLQEALELGGQRADVAFTGAEGVEMALSDPPDAVICDIGLPGMDGYEVAARLRADRRLDDTVLIALTGYASPHDRDRAMAAGFDRHLSKPPQIDQVMDLIARARAVDGVLGSGE